MKPRRIHLRTALLCTTLAAAQSAAWAQAAKEAKPVPILQQNLTTPDSKPAAQNKNAKPAAKPANTPAGMLPTVQGQGDFSGQSVGKLATADADYTCQRLYDSASPMSMVTELAFIIGPAFLLGRVPELSGRSEADNKKLFDDLRRLARTKIWLPVAAERQVGEMIYNKMVKDGDVVPETELNARDAKRLAEIREAMTALTATLPKDNPYQFTLSVIRGDQPNASMQVGGYAFVTMGMLRDRSLKKDDLGLRLAHEAAHMTRRHTLKSFQLKLIDLIEISKDLPRLAKIAADPVNGIETLLATKRAVELLFTRFEHNQELEADACGTFVMQRTPGMKTQPAIKALMTQGKGTPIGQWWESSHPSYEDRERVMLLQLDREQASRSMPESISVVATAPAGMPGVSSLVPAPAPSKAPATPSPEPAAPAPEKPTASSGSFFDRLRSMLPAAATAASAPPQPESPP
jgi:hypothetical protein